MVKISKAKLDYYRKKYPEVTTEKKAQSYKKSIGGSKEKFAKVEEFSRKSEAKILAKRIRINGNNARVLTTTWQGKPLYEVWIGNERK